MAAFEKVVIVGVGLLGGSIGLALRQRGLARQVVGFGRNQRNLDKAVSHGAIDSFEIELETACQGANLCVICTPVQDIASRVVECSPHLDSDGLITDVRKHKAKHLRVTCKGRHRKFLWLASFGGKRSFWRRAR